MGNAIAGCSYRAQLTVEPEPETCIRFSVPPGSEARVLLEDESPATCDAIEQGIGPLVVRHGERAILFEDFVEDSLPVVVEEIFPLAARECDRE